MTCPSPPPTATSAAAPNPSSWNAAPTLRKSSAIEAAISSGEGAPSRAWAATTMPLRSARTTQRAPSTSAMNLRSTSSSTPLTPVPSDPLDPRLEACGRLPLVEHAPERRGQRGGLGGERGTDALLVPLAVRHGDPAVERGEEGARLFVSGLSLQDDADDARGAGEIALRRPQLRVRQRREPPVLSRAPHRTPRKQNGPPRSRGPRIQESLGKSRVLRADRGQAVAAVTLVRAPGADTRGLSHDIAATAQLAAGADRLCRAAVDDQHAPRGHLDRVAVHRVAVERHVQVGAVTVTRSEEH